MMMMMMMHCSDLNNNINEPPITVVTLNATFTCRCLLFFYVSICETLFTSRGPIVFVKQTGDFRSHIQIIECLCVTARAYLGGFLGFQKSQFAIRTTIDYCLGVYKSMKQKTIFCLAV